MTNLKYQTIYKLFNNLRNHIFKNYQYKEELIEVIYFIESNSYPSAVLKLNTLISSVLIAEEKAFFIFIIALLELKMQKYEKAITQFSEVINLEVSSFMLKAISYRLRSESNYKMLYYRAAIEDRLESNKYNLAKEINILTSGCETFLLEKYFINFKRIIEIDRLAFVKLLNIQKPKYDLIKDYSKRIGKEKKSKIIEKLIEKSIQKYKSKDYKGAIRSMRRAEKYF